jgi:hypothetical protein
MQRSQRGASQQAREKDTQIKHNLLVRDASAGHGKHPKTVKLIFAFLPVFPSEKAVYVPSAIQYRIHSHEHPTFNKPGQVLLLDGCLIPHAQT